MSPSKAIETVLLPGLHGSGELFEPLLRVAPANHEITVVTYPTQTKLSFDTLVEIAENQIPAEKPIQLVAESFSGLVAIRLLTRSQRNYKSVVFCAAFASSPVPGFKWLVKAILRLMRVWSGAVSLGVRHFCLNGSGSQTIVEQVSHIIDKIPVSLLQARLEMIGELNLIDELGRINIPSVYLLASQDRLVPRRCTQEFVDNIPTLKLHEIDGPHFLLQACPGVAAKVIFSENVTT